ncbi:MAG: ABC transporter permease [Lachnospiraceae bacterium]|jgi:ribose/xylose/arabinose/galactoside ABC-type transport system permease subunit|nr:ABC transporter permease [Lachnospiraceae bacterium]
MSEKQDNVVVRFIKNNSIWVALIALVALVTILTEIKTGQFFLSLTNILIILNTQSIIGILTVGVMFPILSRGIDLSTSSVVAVTSVVSATLVSKAGAAIHSPAKPWPAGIVVIVCILIGCCVGIFNGSLVAYTKIHPFIATLGATLILKGIALIFTNAAPVAGLSKTFTYLGGGKLIPRVPNTILWMILVIIIGGFLLTQTRFGTNVFAIGGNDVAAKVAGINVERNIIKVYMWCSACAALGGVMYSASTGAGAPTAGITAAYELDAIAAATVGGTSQTGGIAKISGVICGILILAVINNALQGLGVSPYVQQIIKGLIIIIAVVLDMRKNAKKA